MKHHVRALAFCLAFCLMLFGCSAGPAAPSPTPQEPMEEGALPVRSEEEPSPFPEEEEAAPAEEEEEAKTVVGFVVPDDGSLLMRCAMHGFLRTAESLSYPARLYAFSSGDGSSEVEQALADGCGALLGWAETPAGAAAARAASGQGVPVAVPFIGVAPTAAGAVSVLAAGEMDYCSEALRIMCETAISRGNTQGVIVVAREAGAHQEIVDAVQNALNTDYPGYTLQDMPLLATVEETTAQAKEYELAHPEICGVLALSPTSATAWYDGEIQAEKELEDEKRNPVIMALDYTEENISLVSGGRIYCLIARPYYHCAAQALIVLDSYLGGATVQPNIRVNAPIIRNKDLEKYASIVDETKEWFGM